jgi:hypothetical protein
MTKQLKSSKNIDDIKLPVFTKAITPASVRSLDEIDAWIEQDYHLFFDRSQYEKDKLKYAVYKKFVID